MKPLLQVRDLRVAYRANDGSEHEAVAGMSFDIGHGEIVGLMGESGCGKSTTALALLGLLSAEREGISGSVVFRGRELLLLSEREWRAIRGAEIALVFQSPEIALSPVMTVCDQVSEVVHAHRDWDWKRCRAHSKSALARVGLGEEQIFFAYPHQLSGGQRQRVVLAQALACEPALLIADEPTSSLDAQTETDFLALLRGIRNRAGISVLLISHSPEVQATLADRLLVMQKGRIVEEGSVEALYRNPLHPYTRAMLRPPARVESDDRREPGAVKAEQQFANVT